MKKYRALGKQLYPKSEFFDYDKVDFAVGLEDDFSKKIKAVDEVLATDPNNYKAHYLLGGLIYDTLNPQGENPTLPSNYAELETRMITSLKKANEINPNEQNPGPGSRYSQQSNSLSLIQDSLQRMKQRLSILLPIVDLPRK